jgi:precorrin-6Y C5,15-methyltransferase (decarboxylating)
MIMHRCAIIGVLDNGCEGLTPQTLKTLSQADVVIGGTRTLALFANALKQDCVAHDLTGNLSKVPEWIRTAQNDGMRCAVLATGDPLCHGIAAYLLSRLCVESFDILPNVSTLQLACARLSLPWQEIKICSVHTKDAGEWSEGAGAEHGLYALRRAITQHDRLAILTSPDNTPGRIARLLIAANLHEQFQMAVAANLETDDEEITRDIAITEIAARKFPDPNVVLLWRVTPIAKPILFGLSDDSFQQRYPEKGLITKREVRAVSFARMQLRSDSIIWDIGAGSGSVGVEAAQLCPQGHVYAIEKNAGDCGNALVNRTTLGLHNYSLLNGKAPEGLENWPDPDAVFVGGSGGELAALITLILQRLKPGGWLVMNFVTFENIAVAIETLKASDAEWDVTQMQCSRSKPILDMQRLAAENPVWIVSAQKKQAAV